MYFEMVKYEMFFISAVKTLTCGNRWQLDSRCCWCGSGLNITLKGDHVDNELSDRFFWKKNIDFRLFISVSPHRSNAYSQYLCSSSRECCKTSLLQLLCLFNCIILPFSHPCPSALGQIMLYVDGMNGVIRHAETIQWLYTLVGSKVEFSILQNNKKKNSPVIVQ